MDGFCEVTLPPVAQLQTLPPGHGAIVVSGNG